jgi:predicted membrane channel-forming protein YqfA (hemolysin III family)
LARTEVFRGYRAAPVAFSGLLALAAASVQAAWITDPASQIPAYLALWVGSAVVSGLAAGAGMALRGREPAAAWRRRITWLAIEQFVPCLVAGGLLTAVLVLSAPEALWMLPGLWQVLFSLGVFASCRLLPRATFGVAAFYLATGCLCLVLARDDMALSPWAMGIPFGLGQLYAAAVLYWTLERGDVEP